MEKKSIRDPIQNLSWAVISIKIGSKHFFEDILRFFEEIFEKRTEKTCRYSKNNEKSPKQKHWNIENIMQHDSDFRFLFLSFSSQFFHHQEQRRKTQIHKEIEMTRDWIGMCVASCVWKQKFEQENTIIWIRQNVDHVKTFWQQGEGNEICFPCI